ncbi:MAG: hypothetical protein DRN54_01270 [Thaumarchaeota archaeon]|nr:MAG: hypothetical protein DRN54_01270 [Nitrososphaerota archaeon]
MCKHSRLLYLGPQKTSEGYNHYFKCLECGVVIVKLPSGRVFQIGEAKLELKALPAQSIID